ncbi:GDSL esterase/lipase [Panicum miliaceum]|uniref:GDSL esterase/lipase n=1 Tax=Panicum miliaceum TaxID=4540 RepID=A0A3L6PQR4_PANMI|nr:GDSL esterase/lipase [Panicum miliaceum]
MRFLRSSSCISPLAFFFFFFFLVAVIGSTSSNLQQATKYNAMFSFGDSVAETGNICVVCSSNSTELDVLTCTHPPYGTTYFGRPSCRWSDGRVVVDFIAQSLGLPLLPPSKSKGKDFRRGANMAITGATAMNFSFYQSLGIEDPVWNHGSLYMQIQWFTELIPSLCGTKQNCKKFLAKSLFQFGGFGGNDYNIQLLELGLTPEQTMKNTPIIVNATVNGIERLIALGAVHIVVPSILPTGCLPLFLALFVAGSSSESDFDQYGCLKSYNRLTEHHNSMLREQVQILQRKYKSTRIMYADYYSQDSAILLRLAVEQEEGSTTSTSPPDLVPRLSGQSLYHGCPVHALRHASSHVREGTLLQASPAMSEVARETSKVKTEDEGHGCSRHVSLGSMLVLHGVW